MTLRLSGGRRLQSPPGNIARPTSARVRMAVLNLLAAELPGSRWLDLCCGSGVMACEALQRGVAEVVAIERDRRVAAVARSNLEAVAAGMGTNRPQVRVIQSDARRWLVAHAPHSGRPGRLEGLSAPARGAIEAAALSFGDASQGATPCQGRNQATGEGDLAELQSLDPSGLDHGRPGGQGGEQLRAAGQQPFDLIYCDPPWPAGLHAALSEAVSRGGWIRPGGTLVWECPTDEVPAPPNGWTIRDQRRYGGSTVVLLEAL